MNKTYANLTLAVVIVSLLSWFALLPVQAMAQTIVLPSVNQAVDQDHKDFRLLSPAPVLRKQMGAAEKTAEIQQDTSSHLLVPLAQDPISFTGDSEGGACVASLDTNRRPTLLRYDSSGKLATLATATDPSLTGKQMFISPGQRYGFQRYSAIGCDKQQAVFFAFAFSPAGQPSLMQLPFGGKMREVATTFTPLTIMDGALSTNEKIVDVADLSLQNGRTFFAPMINGNGKMFMRFLDYNLANNTGRALTNTQTERSLGIDNYYWGCLTAHDWFVPVGLANGQAGLFRNMNGQRSLALSDNLKVMSDDRGAAVACNSDTAVFSYSDTSGYHFAVFKDGAPGYSTFTLSNLGGTPLTDHTAHQLTDDGRLVFLMGTSLVEVDLSTQQGRVLVKNSVNGVTISGNRIYYSGLNAAGGAQLFVLLDPRLGEAKVTNGRVTQNCDGCGFGSYKPEVMVAGQPVTVTYENGVLTYQLPPGATGKIAAEFKLGSTRMPFTISATPRPAPTASLVAEPAAISPGDKTTLSWSTTNATQVSITPGIGSVATKGSIAVSPQETTTYTLTATNLDDVSVQATAVVTVKPAPTGPEIAVITGQSAPLTKFAPGMFATIWGINLGTSGQSDGTTTSLNGTEVSVCGQPAEVWYISETLPNGNQQLNFRVPDTAPTTDTCNITVSINGAASDPYPLPMAEENWDIFVFTATPPQEREAEGWKPLLLPVVTHNDPKTSGARAGNRDYGQEPLRLYDPQDLQPTIWATGCKTNGDKPAVSLDGKPVLVTYANRHPDFKGLCQINLDLTEIVPDLSWGPHDLRIADNPTVYSLWVEK